jgi:hypothetical protein
LLKYYSYKFYGESTMKKKVIYGISLSALGIGVALTTTFSLSSCTSGPVATTEFGKVRGMTENNGILGFKGIPYAKAPVGDLRFAHPLNPEP